MRRPTTLIVDSWSSRAVCASLYSWSSSRVCEFVQWSSMRAVCVTVCASLYSWLSRAVSRRLSRCLPTVLLLLMCLRLPRSAAPTAMPQCSPPRPGAHRTHRVGGRCTTTVCVFVAGRPLCRSAQLDSEAEHEAKLRQRQQPAAADTDADTDADPAAGGGGVRHQPLRRLVRHTLRLAKAAAAQQPLSWRDDGDPQAWKARLDAWRASQRRRPPPPAAAAAASSTVRSAAAAADTDTYWTVGADETASDLDDDNECSLPQLLSSDSGSGLPTAASAADSADSDDAAAAVDADDAAAADVADDQPLDDVELDGGFRLPGEIDAALFGYQRTGVRWLWELHCQQAGGIIGDEMGLGKTIQTIAFIAGLHHSRLLTGPVLIVVPATVLQQWVHEFHRWYPPLRVAILHPSGSHQGSRAELVRSVARTDGAVLLTTYDSVRANLKLLLKQPWHYVILDEGHKIRNPDAAVTLALKQFGTAHRLVLSGAPIQNNLTELWSLFDFVFPGKLGTLPTFQAEFAVPITLGGYTNASSFQVQTAYRCAQAVRQLIKPYLLRRLKRDVLTDQLPDNREQVLLCRLTADQRDDYLAYLASDEVASILDGKRNVLAGIDTLRKICNHPDLIKRLSSQRPADYGRWQRSAKLAVLQALLPDWLAQHHKVLLFAQTRQMLDILELFMQEEGFTYVRLDGNVAIKQRMTIVEHFNTRPSVFVFLLSTRVGGLGLNLVGANRVIIFDPDWNPSNDTQARERACRIGQTRDVVVYRLLTAGTIEEKIYHRQIFKQFLTNKILKNPDQNRFFRLKQLKELFTLGADGPHQPATDTELLFGAPSADSLSSQATGIVDGVPQPQPAAAAVSDSDSDADDTDTEVSSNKKKQKKQKKKDEAWLLRKLLDDGDSGLRGIVSHDAVLDQADQHQAHTAQQREAARVAQRAVDAVRRSRAACYSRDVSVPTWTGRSGAAGAPPSAAATAAAFATSATAAAGRPRFGQASRQPVLLSVSATPAGAVDSNTDNYSAPGYVATAAGQPQQQPLRSGDLLHRLQQHQPASGSTASDPASELVSASELVAAMFDFLQRRPSGAASTQDILDHFKIRVQKENLLVFRNILHEIADFDKAAKVWTLRDEADGQSSADESSSLLARATDEP
eukprot:TRINITY_DN2117_c0_g1_i4.p1 TRINITY_DN2117_c0_g1~~TRINITY_DN2117_c0_g1_i4.p1  ORF type:complete len:1139 (-),score=414.46 TRINITY_DN2117_c0_g1_i4:186-3602(-)